VRRFLQPGLGRRVGVVVAVVAIVTQLGVLGFGGWALANPSIVRDTLVVGKTAETTNLDAYVADTGMSSAGRFFLFAAHPTLHTPDTFATACPVREAGIAVLGCYSAKNDTIHLLDITDDKLTTLEPVVAAHEMLHAVWARLDPTERTTVAAEVEASFGSVSDPALLVRLAPYQSMSPTKRDGELFAILGTETANVTPALSDIYARYFDARMKCIELAASSANIIAEIVSQIESVGNQILIADGVIGKQLKQYKRESRKLASDIATFNRHANIAGYYQSASKFTTDRKALAKRTTVHETQRTKLNTLIEQYNSLVDQMAVLNAQATSLNQALGIDASAMESVNG
jgi:hypothetical protein